MEKRQLYGHQKERIMMLPFILLKFTIIVRLWSDLYSQNDFLKLKQFLLVTEKTRIHLILRVSSPMIGLVMLLCLLVLVRN